EAVSGRDALAPGGADSLVADQGATGDADDRALVVDAAAEALAVGAGGVGAALGQVVEQRAVDDGQRRGAIPIGVLDSATQGEAIVQAGGVRIAAATDGLVAAQRAVDDRENPAVQVIDAATRAPVGRRRGGA